MTLSDLKFSNINKLAQAIVFIFVAVTLVACGGGATGDNNNYITIDDQALIDLNTIVISQAHIEQTVCVLIYKSYDVLTPVKSNELWAKQTLTAGDYTDLSIRLSETIGDNEFMFAELQEKSCDNESGVAILQDGNFELGFQITRSTMPYVAINNFKLVGQNLIISKVITNKSTWVVVHQYDSESETLGDVVGTELVDIGHSADIAVFIQIAQQGKGSGVGEGDELIVVLYEDKGQLEDFDLDEDTLLIDAKSSKFNIKLSQDIIRFVLTINGNANYQWTGDDDAANAKIISQTNVGNEDIELTVGETYQIYNPRFSSHPFSLLNSTGKVLLSQGSEGSYEANSNVNWLDDENGYMTFTLTQALADELFTYRCSIHSGMTGGFVI